ncbi:MAG: COX15/CtaA family protein [Woeseiaceae bacterium]|nr:COX15/CtaA family protein [Woeseiaceae bacterium]
MSDATLQNRAVATWLLVLCGLVFAMVVLGGFTRLTGSGLSMVDWRPILGILPPLTDADWQRVYEMYKQSPEFQKVNFEFGIDEFKGIFWLEYLHRLLGRILGLAFLVPFVYFVVRGYIQRSEWLKYGVMFVLGGMQGLLGWYMVKSGLVDVPEVSHYRLTAHLVSAFIIYAYIFWVAMSLLFPAMPEARKHPWYGRTLAMTALVAVTIVSGGFVAGLKAGKIYNTFPMMGDFWVPPGLMALEPFWRNFFDNIVTVQFDHRLLAISTFAVVVLYWLKARKSDLPGRARPAVNAVLHTVILQVVLGISTLLMAVPVLLGAAHQAVAMLLFTVLLYLVHALRRV